MCKDDLEKLITDNMETGYFTGGIEKKLVDKIEEDLDILLPNSYKHFLMKYGSGGIFGVDILGAGKTDQPFVVTETEKYRQKGLEKDLVLIEDCDEFLYCLDTSEMVNEECPVVSWDQHEGIDSIESANFCKFLLERFIDSKEAWEEDF
nr:SMI1/KNR4 family protein [Oceanobacillus senegalensis]